MQFAADIHEVEFSNCMVRNRRDVHLRLFSVQIAIL